MQILLFLNTTFLKHGPSTQTPHRSICPLSNGITSLKASTNNIPLTLENIIQAASNYQIELRNKSLGPFIRFETHSKDTGTNLGYINGYILFNRLTIEAYKTYPHSQTSTTTSHTNGLVRVTPGIVLFLAAVAIGGASGCENVYGLAIRDAGEQHRRLVMYLMRWGGEKVGKVGNRVGDIGWRLIYGGEGTIIRADVCEMLERGRRLLKIDDGVGKDGD